ncbi:MAG: flagellar basal body-associated FliL family protein [Bdellovibrionales bacterium]|nr:flagellar basal body-associated FliL family protein [Bdellovibrionales bacterium]
MISATYWIFSLHRKEVQSSAHHVTVEHEDEADEPEGDHGGEHGGGEGHGGGHEGGHEAGAEGHEGGFARNPIPKSIRARQDGIPEEGHDLVDPDITATRSLASVLKDSELKVKLPHVFVDVPEIIAATRASGGFSSKVVVSTTIEVDSNEAQRELLERKVEIQALISSLISEVKGEALKTPEGIADFKLAIQREINHMLKSGKVIDVLFPQIFVM